MRTAIYLRQSQDRDGDELAVSRQRDLCLKLCKAKSWTDTIEYQDNNVSASSRTKERRAYRRMLADIEAGLVGAVVVYDLDRLHRQPIELEEFINLADQHALKLATVDTSVDLSTDNGRLFARIKGAVARSEVERKSRRQKDKNQQTAEAGGWMTSHRPFGYTVSRRKVKDAATGKDKSVVRVTLQKKEADLLEIAYDDVLNGAKSLREIAKQWNLAHVPTVRGAEWTNGRIRRMLLNPRYAGLLPRQVEEINEKSGERTTKTVNYKGSWPPVVSEETYNGVVAILSDPSRKICTTFAIAHQGAGTYRCGHRDAEGNPDCGSPMKTHYDKHGKRNYACKATPHLIRRGETLDAYVTAVILEKLAEPGADVLLPDEPDVDTDDLRSRQAALIARRKAIVRSFRNGQIDSDDYDESLADLNPKIDGLQSQITDAVKAQSHAAEFVAGEGDLWDRWQRLTPRLRGLVINDLATVTVLPSPLGLRGFDSTYVDVQLRKASEPPAEDE